MTKQQQAERDEARAALRKILRPGTTVHTVLRHVSSSGMSRRISLVVATGRGKIRDVSGLAARALGYRRNGRDGALVVGGCGMNMGHSVVHALSYALHGRESKGDGRDADARGVPFTPRPGHYRAGYSLQHEWV